MQGLCMALEAHLSEYSSVSSLTPVLVGRIYDRRLGKCIHGTKLQALAWTVRGVISPESINRKSLGQQRNTTFALVSVQHRIYLKMEG